MAVRRGVIGVRALLLCGMVIQAVAGIGAGPPLTATDLQSPDAPPTGTGVDLALADDWGTVGVNPNLVISGGACRGRDRRGVLGRVA
jgi:hypothetical protein